MSPHQTRRQHHPAQNDPDRRVEVPPAEMERFIAAWERTRDYLQTRPASPGSEAARAELPAQRVAVQARVPQLSPLSSPPLTAEPLEVTTGDGRAGLPPLAVLALPGAPGVTVVVAGTAGWGWCAK
jgi:hypothetical protein